jgi:hypothetical protein
MKTAWKNQVLWQGCGESFPVKTFPCNIENLPFTQSNCVLQIPIAKRLLHLKIW